VLPARNQRVTFSPKRSHPKNAANGGLRYMNDATEEAGRYLSARFQMKNPSSVLAKLR